MLVEETLQKVGRRQYEEPDGEYLELIGSGSNTISVLTRVDDDESDSGKGGAEAPFDPVDHTVSELKDSLDHGSGLDDDELLALLEAEERGKNRTTAINAIKERLQ